MNYGDPKTLPQNIINAIADPEVRKELKVLSTAELAEKGKARETLEDRAVQRQIEALLRHKGYMPRTEEAIMEGSPKGWFIHYNPVKTKGNPYILDLLIWREDGTAVLELELKTKTGKPSEIQKAILNASRCSAIAYGVDEAARIVDHWDKWTDAPEGER